MQRETRPYRAELAVLARRCANLIYIPVISRATGKPLFLAVNKIDHSSVDHLIHDFHELGLNATSDEQRFEFLLREADCLEAARDYDAALTLLEKTGFTYESGLEETLAMLEAAGAKVDRAAAKAMAARDVSALRADVESGAVKVLYVVDPGPEGSLGDVQWVIDARANGALPLLKAQGYEAPFAQVRLSQHFCPSPPHGAHAPPRHGRQPAGPWR